MTSERKDLSEKISSGWHIHIGFQVAAAVSDPAWRVVVRLSSVVPGLALVAGEGMYAGGFDD